MSKRIIIGASLLTVIAIAAVGYVAILPVIQINHFKKAAEAKHQQINDKMARVYDSFKRGVFTKPDSRSASDKTDVQAGKEAVKDALATINANAPGMTKFSAWPLLNWNKQYKLAADTNAAEETYLKQARTFLADYSALLDYTSKVTGIKAQTETAITNISKLDDQPTLASLTTALDADTIAYKAILSQETTLVPPSYLKTGQDKSIATGNQLIAGLSDLSAAARALDLDKINKISASFDKLVADANQEDQALISTLQHGSLISHEISSLQTAGSRLAGNYTKL